MSDMKVNTTYARPPSTGKGLPTGPAQGTQAGPNLRASGGTSGNAISKTRTGGSPQVVNNSKQGKTQLGSKIRQQHAQQARVAAAVEAEAAEQHEAHEEVENLKTVAVTPEEQAALNKLSEAPEQK